MKIEQIEALHLLYEYPESDRFQYAFQWLVLEQGPIVSSAGDFPLVWVLD